MTDRWQAPRTAGAFLALALLGAPALTAAALADPVPSGSPDPSTPSPSEQPTITLPPVTLPPVTLPPVTSYITVTATASPAVTVTTTTTPSPAPTITVTATRQPTKAALQAIIDGLKIPTAVPQQPPAPPAGGTDGLSDLAGLLGTTVPSDPPPSLGSGWPTATPVPQPLLQAAIPERDDRAVGILIGIVALAAVGIARPMVIRQWRMWRMWRRAVSADARAELEAATAAEIGRARRARPKAPITAEVPADQGDAPTTTNLAVPNPKDES